MEEIRRQRHVSCAGNANRLPIVQGLQFRQLFQMLQDEITELPDQPASL